MAVLWSRIHAELGVPPSELTYDMIVRAVERGVMESDDLDWKQALPVDVDKKQKEFAKDVAAMANTGGGLIIYGVREDKERAVEITPVSTAERERERLRALATRHVRPLIGGIEIVPLSADEDDDDGIIAVFVPASPDAPHVIGERNEMGVPFRHGAHTEWMSEYQIERAYRDRFSRQAGETEAMAALLTEVAGQLDLAKSVWLVVIGRPLSPQPAVMSRPDRSHVDNVLTDTHRISVQIEPTLPAHGHVLEAIGDDGRLNPRIGLRRWVARSNNAASPGTLTDFVHIELHHDGTSVTAVAIAEWAVRAGFEGVHPVPVQTLQFAVVEAVALATTHARRRGHTSQLLLQASLLKPENELPFAAVDNPRVGSITLNTLEIVPGSRAPKRITPVHTELSSVAEPDEHRAGVRQLCEDLVHQFGVLRLVITE